MVYKRNIFFLSLSWKYLFMAKPSKHLRTEVWIWHKEIKMCFNILKPLMVDASVCKVMWVHHPTMTSATHKESNNSTGMLDLANFQLNPCSKSMLASQSEIGYTVACFVTELSKQLLLIPVTRCTGLWSGLSRHQCCRKCTHSPFSLGEDVKGGQKPQFMQVFN